MSANLARFATFTRELADIAARVLQDRLGATEADATELGLHIAQQVCSEFSGQTIYVPSNARATIDDRDRAMLALYLKTGKNIDAVAKTFGVSMNTAYLRIRLAKAADYQSRQAGLFEPPSEGI